MKSWENYETFEERLPNHVFIQRVADAAGVSTQSVHRVAKKRLQKEGKRDRKRLKGCPYTFVSLSLWDEYMEIGPVKRVAAKPKGWLTAKALLEDGFSKRKLYQLVREGSIKAVYVGNTLYLEPEGAQRYIQTRQDLRPPPGWVSVSELRERAGRSKQALSTYLKRHGVETAQFLHPKRDQLVQYIRTEDAQKYLRCQGGLSASETAQMDGRETAQLEVSECSQNDLTAGPALTPHLNVNLEADLATDSDPRATDLASEISPSSNGLQTAKFTKHEEKMSALTQPVSQPSESLISLEYATDTSHGGIAAHEGSMASSRLPGYNERETSMCMSNPSFVLPHCGSEPPCGTPLTYDLGQGSNRPSGVLALPHAPSVLSQPHQLT